MKGLFWKEWSILTRSYKQIVLFLVVIYGLLGIAMGQTTMAYALQVVFSIMVTSTIAFDENSHWDAYARTLPVTPSQIVGCKYLFGLGGLAAGSVLAALIVALSNLLDEPILIYHTVDKVGAIDLAAALLVCGSLSLLFVGLILPLSYCFNSARARSSIFLVFGAFGDVYKRQDGDSRSVDAPLRLSFGHALDAEVELEINPKDLRIDRCV